jgi:MFS family permease
LAVTFLIVETHIRAPMVPQGILVDPARRAAISATMLLGAVVVGYVYFTSLYLQEVLGFSPLETGLAFIPATLTVIVTFTQLTRRVLPHLGVRKVLVAGLASVAIGQIWLSTISSTGSYQLNVLGGILLTAFGMGLTFPTASVAITAGVGPGERGLAGGLFVTSQQIGQAIGLAVLATVAAAVTNNHHGSLAGGYRAAYLVAIGFAVLAALIVAIQVRARRSASRTV